MRMYTRLDYLRGHYFMNTLVVAVSLVLSDAMLEITCSVRRQERTTIMELAQACDPVTLSANPLHSKYDLKSL